MYYNNHGWKPVYGWNKKSMKIRNIIKVAVILDSFYEFRVFQADFLKQLTTVYVLPGRGTFLNYIKWY
jgi:hypothetical protein